MSWGGIPGYVYDVVHQRELMKQSGAFEEEKNSGYTRAHPQHWIMLDRSSQALPERRTASLGVTLWDGKKWLS